MLFIFGWIIYGLLVGLISKYLHPGEDPVGFLPTVGIGVAGSYVGGFINWAIGVGMSPISPSGLMSGVIGGIIFCWAYRKYRLNRFFEAQGRMPENVKK